MEPENLPASRLESAPGGFPLDAGLTELFERASGVCREVFGFSALRPHQAQVLTHVLDGRDCLAVLPTGSGKSLCYALPALIRPGLVLVVSPLIALIRDQVRRFQTAGVACASLDSMQSLEEKDGVWRQIECGELKLLFVSPERLARLDFREKLQSLPIQLVAIDEAHCISQWGNHFRPDYRWIGGYLAGFGIGANKAQRLALTATATAKVRDDIAQSLQLDQPATVWADFARKNLKVKVVRADKIAEQLTAILQLTLEQEGPGIVYTPTRKSAREVHRMLSDAGIKAGVYHAGLTPEQRTQSQRAFMEGSLRVMVATHAFGMGIDKADIRFVHHAGLPGSLEQYVQEIGRAGRDGKPATCALIYGPRDYHIQKFMIDKSYPNARLLKNMLSIVPELLHGSPGRSERWLVRELTNQLDPALKADEEEVTEALRVLCRDGLLTHYKASGGGYGEHAEILVSEGDLAGAAAWLAAYPGRRSETLAKLDAMRGFVAATGNRMQVLDDYFRQGDARQE